MDIAKRAIEIVQNTERQLLELAGSALASGEYRSIRVAELAKAVGELAHFPGLNGEVEEPDATALRTSHKDGKANERERGPRPRRAPRKGEYPKFFRRGENLIKIGWSKKDRSEYEHKASRRALEALASAITLRQGKGRVFTSDDLLPLKDPQDGSEIPGYQMYVALAWFRAMGLVTQHGRSGYSATNSADVRELASQAWEQLSEKRIP